MITDYKRTILEITQNELLAGAYGEYFQELGGGEMPPRFIQESKVMGGSTDFGNVRYVHSYNIYCMMS